MKQEMIKQIVRVGNSAGVILPKEWLNGKAKVELIVAPTDIKKEIFEILKDYLWDIRGIYLAGSYARKEETEKSDIDTIVITGKTNKKIEKGKHSILFISQEKVEAALKDNVLPILPMLKEAKTLLNEELIIKYKQTELTQKNLAWHIESTKSILKIIKEFIELNREYGKTSDAVSYSLILRIRGIYIVDSLIKKKMWTKKELLKLIDKISGSLEAYEGYLRVKNNMRKKENLPIEQAEKLYNYIDRKIREQEKWLTRKK